MSFAQNLTKNVVEPLEFNTILVKKSKVAKNAKKLCKIQLSMKK